MLDVTKVCQAQLDFENFLHLIWGTAVCFSDINISDTSQHIKKENSQSSHHLLQNSSSVETAVPNDQYTKELKEETSLDKKLQEHESKLLEGQMEMKELKTKLNLLIEQNDKARECKEKEENYNIQQVMKDIGNFNLSVKYAHEKINQMGIKIKELKLTVKKKQLKKFQNKTFSSKNFEKSKHRSSKGKLISKQLKAMGKKCDSLDELKSKIKDLQIELEKKSEVLGALVENTNEYIKAVGNKYCILQDNIDSSAEHLNTYVTSVEHLNTHVTESERKTNESLTKMNDLMLEIKLKCKNAEVDRKQLWKMLENPNELHMILAPDIPDLKTVALEACESGNWENCHKLLEPTLEKFSFQVIEKNILNCASKNGFIQIISVFLKNGFPVNQAIDNSERWTLLHVAAAHGQLMLVDLLIFKGAEVNVTNKSKYTPLHLASYRGHLSVVKQLIKYGANINAKYIYNVTSLSLAAMFGHLNVVQVLTDEGCDKFEKDTAGKTAYSYLYDGIINNPTAISLKI